MTALEKLINALQEESGKPILYDHPACGIWRALHNGSCSGCESEESCTKLNTTLELAIIDGYQALFDVISGMIADRIIVGRKGGSTDEPNTDYHET